MISRSHTDILREQVHQAGRVLEGWKYLLAHAEQVEKAGAAERLPDPLLGVGQPWPNPAPEPWRPTVEPVNGRAPYAPAETGASVYDGTLPPEQENALGLLASEHAAYAQTAKARDEDEKWRQA